MKKKIQIEQVLKGLHKLANADADSFVGTEHGMSEDGAASIFTVESYMKQFKIEDLTYKELLDWISKTEENYHDVQKTTGLYRPASNRADDASTQKKRTKQFKF